MQSYAHYLVTLAFLGWVGVAAHAAYPEKPVRIVVPFAPGGNVDLTGEFFQLYTGVQFLHIPYKGTGPALIDLIGGQVDLIFDQLTTSSPHIASGRLRPLAVSTLKRSALLKNIPTMHESGAQGFEVITYTGLAAPAATPKEILQRIYAALVKTLPQSTTRDNFSRLGAEVTQSTPEAFFERLRRDLANWRKVRDQLQLKLD